MRFGITSSYEFVDSPLNPLIAPPPFEWLIADPTVLTPAQSPDGQWHLWANSLRGIHHYISEDGFRWRRQKGPLFGGLRPFVRLVNDRFVMFYERFLKPRLSVIAMRVSDDLSSWSEPETVLSPSLTWEGNLVRTNGNPCLVVRDYVYRLYYSAGLIFLSDCMFPEPRFIGVAESDRLEGPYTKKDLPIIAPSQDEEYRNFGAGAIKVYTSEEKFIGFNNGIYKDRNGRSRSAILLLESEDGFAWRAVIKEPILAPQPRSWKRAFVYQLDVVEYGGKMRLYYNARDGWFIGKERIGVAVSECSLEKSYS